MSSQAEGARRVQRAIRDAMKRLKPHIPDPVADELNSAVIRAVLEIELEAAKQEEPK